MSVVDVTVRVNGMRNWGGDGGRGLAGIGTY